MAESLVFNMDCIEGMRQFPDGFFDLAVVDPPYGINITGRHRSKAVHVERERETRIVGGAGRPFGGNHSNRGKRKREIPSTFYHAFDDSSPPDAEYFRELARVSKHRIIWGGNFFDGLGPASCMIIWDKMRRGMDQADCHAAQMNLFIDA